MSTRIDFEPIEHVYTVTVDGTTYRPASVTTLIGAALNMYNGIPGEIMQAAAERGTAVHAALEACEKQGGKMPDDIDPISYSARAVREYLKIKKKHRIMPLMLETPICYIDDDGIPLYAGTFDNLSVIFEDGAPALAIIDYKTTAQLHLDALALQLPAYAIGIEQMYPDLRITQGYCIHIPSKGPARIVKVDMLPRQEVVRIMRDAYFKVSI